MTLMENEKLKEVVWAKCQDQMPFFDPKKQESPYDYKDAHRIHGSVGFIYGLIEVDGHFENGYIFPSRHGGAIAQIYESLDADAGDWWIAAKLLDIPTEMPIEEIERDIAARQYQHDIDEARKEGFENAKAQKLTSAEQELCDAIRNGMGKFAFTQTNDDFIVSLNSGTGMDAVAFGRLFDRVMTNNGNEVRSIPIVPASERYNEGSPSSRQKPRCHRSILEYVLGLVIDERKRQDAKWGADRNLHPYHWNTILGEEVGEVNEASFDAAKDPAHLLEELVQVAAVSVAYAEYVKRTYSI